MWSLCAHTETPWRHVFSQSDNTYLLTYLVRSHLGPQIDAAVILPGRWRFSPGRSFQARAPHITTSLISRKKVDDTLDRSFLRVKTFQGIRSFIVEILCLRGNLEVYVQHLLRMIPDRHQQYNDGCIQAFYARHLRTPSLFKEHVDISKNLGGRCKSVKLERNTTG